ncbi:hypothetical protein V6N13_013964 [Hibiscus sabdariffa]
MSNEDGVYGDILVGPPLTTAWEFGMESTEGELESPNESESKKRDRTLVSDDSPENKREGTKKQSRSRRSFSFGGWSNSKQQPETTTEAEAERSREQGKKDVAKGAKLLVDRIDRRIKTLKSADMESKISAYKTVLMRASHLSPEFHHSLEQIEKQWTPAPDLHKLKQHIKKVEVDFKEGRLTDDEANQSLLQVENKLKQIDQQLEDLKKMRDTDSTFAKNTFSSPLPCVVTGDRKKLESEVNYLRSQVYDKENNKVEYKEFQGLEEELKNTAWGKTPDNLEAIASRIERARGKATEVAHSVIQVLVCAAIKEMEDFPVEDLDWDSLRKWGATLNMAKELDFHVAFADNLLNKNLLAFAYSTTIGSD